MNSESTVFSPRVVAFSTIPNSKSTNTHTTSEKEMSEHPDNDKILGAMLAQEIIAARKKRWPSAEELV